MAIFSKPARLLPADFVQKQRRPLVLAALIIVLLRSRLGEIGKEVAKKVVKGKGRADGKLSKEESLRVLQRVYEEVPGDEETKVLLVPYRDRVTKVPIRPIPQQKLDNDRTHFPLLPPSAQNKPNIDMSFLRQLRAILLRIVLPPNSWDGKGASPLWRSRQVGILTLHSAFLVLRTVLSILVARLDGRIVRDLVKGDGKGFLKGLGLWFVLAIPSTYTNSMIRHLQSILSLGMRTKLSRYVNDLYLSSYPDLRYYRVSAHGPTSAEGEGHDAKTSGGLDGVEQYITSDVESWASAISGIYGNLLKPSLDMLLFTSQLSRSLGFRGTALLFLNYYGTVAILRAVTPAFGRLAAIEAKLEGEYRRGMGRVGRESEEVAFYNGGHRERDILTKAYLRLIKHVNSIYKIRIAYEWTEDFVIKYLWSAAGYCLIAVPILFTRTKRSLAWQSDVNESRPPSIGERLEDSSQDEQRSASPVPGSACPVPDRSTGIWRWPQRPLPIRNKPAPHPRASRASLRTSHSNTPSRAPSRVQSLIKKSIELGDLKPTDVLIERFVAWKAIVKQLAAYFEVRSRSSLPSPFISSVPFAPSTSTYTTLERREDGETRS
ncbi:hypothetical protein NMY22_g8604 [Coprinellus aureogranulatus]|nr:hypothetical protein NMY22_g8604 [Coprinellus aureogranulatus]